MSVKIGPGSVENITISKNVQVSLTPEEAFIFLKKYKGFDIDLDEKRLLEKVISSDAYCSYKYATSVIYDRFIKGEKAINNSDYKREYEKFTRGNLILNLSHIDILSIYSTDEKIIYIDSDELETLKLHVTKANNSTENDECSIIRRTATFIYNLILNYKEKYNNKITRVLISKSFSGLTIHFLKENLKDHPDISLVYHVALDEFNTIGQHKLKFINI